MTKPIGAMPEIGTSDPVAFKACQDLLRSRLTTPELQLVPQLTGIRLCVLWHRLSDFQRPGAVRVFCPTAVDRSGGKQPWPTRCESCMRRRWETIPSLASRGRRFLGRCGVTNFCATLHVDQLCPLTLILQARVASRFPGSCNVSQREGQPFVARRAGKPASAAAFQHGVELTRLILHDLESTARAQIARNGLRNALHKLNNNVSENTHPGSERRHRAFGLPKSEGRPGAGSQGRKLVEAMRNHVYQHYHRPIGLKDMALVMKRNASYLSALFSQTTGVPFHRFLEEVRLSKARELLRDPRNRIVEVACAVGYASPVSFRHAFKARAGLSPEAWRARQ
ncbi:MAG TPA: AraC family transcriptional regulator [Verrucomicrobiae bacterium]|nr:AraC family transcriptional regulator [Verrucomicrobiae bacterium]